MGAAQAVAGRNGCGGWVQVTKPHPSFRDVLIWVVAITGMALWLASWVLIFLHGIGCW